MDCKCIPKLDRSWPPSSHDHGLQVHLQTRSIAASKYIFHFTRSRPPGASLSSLDQGLPVHLQTHSIMASKCISELHHLGLHVHPQTRSITASKCTSKLVPLQSPRASLSSLDYGLPAYFYTHSITASKCISKFTQ